MPTDDSCCVCGRRHAEHLCSCGLQLCHKHRECPECEREHDEEPDSACADAGRCPERASC